MSNDFIPKPDDQFDGFFTAFNTYAQANAAALGLTNGQITALGGVFAGWQTNWAAWQTEQNTYNSLLAAKNEARDAAVAFLRQINGIV